MNPENIKQVIETIKTLNINFNDATTQKIADAILPIVKFYFITEIFRDIFWGAIRISFAIIAYKLFLRVVEVEKEKKFKKLEEENK